jgi:hypothetical protein
VNMASQITMSPPSANYLLALKLIVSDERGAQSTAHLVVVDEPPPWHHHNLKSSRTLVSN